MSASSRRGASTAEGSNGERKRTGPRGGPRSSARAAAARAPDHARVANAVAELIAALGHDLAGELAGTPERVASAWIDEFTAGDRIDAAALLRGGALDLGQGPHGIVLVRDIAIATTCPHHLLPSHGFATIAYAPKRLAAGLGAIAEAAVALGRKLTLQEALGRDIAETFVRALDANGALCRLDLVHTCFVARGECQARSTLTTLAFAGSFDGPDRGAALAALAAPDAPRATPNGHGGAR